MENWGQGIALVLLAVLLEAIVDLLMDRFQITKRGKKDPRGHH